jgi:hypothetical protein
LQTTRILLSLVLLGGSSLSAKVTVQLTAPASSILVGQTLTITATAHDTAAPDTRFSYQFTVRPHATGPFIVQQDYYWTNTFPWTPSDHEGEYDIGVTAWSEKTHDAAPTFITVNVLPRVVSGTPVISATNNALVALYSAPACSAPSTMKVRFQAQGGGPVVFTPSKPCTGQTLNFYIGGMVQQSTYNVQQFLQSGFATIAGPVLTWHTGSVPSDIPLPNHFRLAGPQPPTSSTYPFLLRATLGDAPFATDLNENVLWYRPITAPRGYMVKLLRGGTFLTIDDDPIDSAAHCGSAVNTGCGDHQFLRELDLAGNVIRSTSWAVVNDEINGLRAKQGGSKVRLNFFSHDAIRLPNGYTVTMATDEQVKHLNSGTQDVFADVIIALDKNWQVVWAWDAFDYLDLNRMTIGGTCVIGGPGCPGQFFNRQPNGKLYTSALDWTHANSISFDTRDNNLLISLRHQSWVIKINFNNGKGNGDIIWKLGYGGSFALAPGYPVSDWFSGEHDARYMSNGLLTLFDNNNPSKVTQQPGGTAHGQAWRLDTTNMVATPVVNVDLGVVSLAVGSAVLLSNGNYHWQAGFIAGNQSQSFETTPSGDQVYKEQTDALSYRSFRVSDLYTPQLDIR